MGVLRKSTPRRLTAILAADVVGYSRHMEANEAATHEQLKIDRAQIFAPKISEYRGHIFHTAGDSILAEFSSVVDALECAINIQEHLARRRESDVRADDLVWRIGINLGDVIVDADELYGEGVNVAARLEGLAEPGGICISEAVFTQTKNKVDVACQSLGNRRLKNVVEPVHVYRVLTRSEGAPKLTGGKMRHLSRSVPDKPAIAVLPFANMTPNQDKQYLVDGIAEDLIADLSMFPEFFVAARTSSFAFKDRQIDAREVARELGVSYVIEGSMQQDGRGIRITAQLIDSESGSHLWTGRYDRPSAELFEVRDEITRSIAATLMTTSGLIARAELVRRAQKPPDSFTVYDHYLRARDFFHRSIMPPWNEGKESSRRAKAEFKKAIKKSDPPYWPAFAGLAWQHAVDFDWGYTPDPNKSAELAFDNASIAVKNSPDDYMGHWILGWAYLFSRRDHEKAMLQYEIAHSMNPGDSRLLAEMVQPLIYVGRFEEAISKLKEAIYLNPLHEQWYDEFLGWAYEESGKPENTIELLNKLGELEGLWSHAVLALAYAQTGELDRFKGQIAVIDSMTSQQFKERFSSGFWRRWVQTRNPYKDAARAERVIGTMASSLKLIGVED